MQIWILLFRIMLVVASSLLVSVTRADTPPPDPQELADRIDLHLAASWKDAGVEPAPLASDAEFLRRVSLDLTGRIQSVRDVHEFLADVDPAKRRRLVDRLLESPRHATHFAALWRALLISEVGASADARFFQTGFELWLRDRWRARVGYDQLVRELLTVPLRSDSGGEVVFRQPNQPNPLAFYAVKEGRPENLAATSTRVFLGIQIECAQCHDHPFARWSRDQFWNQAAFFAGIEKRGNGLFAPLAEVAGRREVMPTNATTAVRALLLDRQEPAGATDASPRAALARWITAPENPYFARATVNRLWGQLFGTGIVEPVDDFHDAHPPSHPELLDDLARSFVAARFDIGYLLRGICLSQAYQRTSAQTHASQEDPRAFARMAVRGLTGEQFFDSFALATGYREGGSTGRERGSARERFLAQFAPTGRLSQPETSILQALTLMNGRVVADATTVDRSSTLTAVVSTPFMDLNQRIEALYLATLNRKPTVPELERLQPYVGKASKERESERLADIFWVLLNSAEFRLNH